MITEEKGALVRRRDKELLRIECWGCNSFRVRATQRREFNDDSDLSALLPLKDVDGDSLNVQNRLTGECGIYEEGTSTFIKNGKIICELTRTGRLLFYRAEIGTNGRKVLLAEYQRTRGMSEEGRKEFNSALEIEPRTFEPYEGMDNFKLTVRFEPSEDEKLFGMGQYQQPYLNLKGCRLELAHRNSQASVPFVLSNKGYGMLWNNPAIGDVTFGRNVTEWSSISTKQMDYWITAGDSPEEIERAYASATGKVPMMPEYGLGFWQCKLRYQTQDEILKVAHGYKNRNLHIDVIVVDFFHWPHEGEWKFDEEYWPDPEAMVRELGKMGIKLMVSIWPTVDAESENYEEMVDKAYLIRSESGKRLGQLGNAAIIDVTHPDARHYVWDKIKKNYYDKGIHIFWLDEAEPELTGYEYRHYRYYRGADLEIGNIYPRDYARMAYEGMENAGQKSIVNLLRCAWAGSQKYGALIWSGDIDSSFRSLRNQLSAGLNMGIAGIPWWTTDIGGFHGGNINDPEFHEVFVRWFEFGTFCPVMRLHGNREPFKQPLGTSGGGKCPSGADNEVWSYGDEVYEICKKYLALREKLRPYTRKIMKMAHDNGDPVMRPLFYDFPDDEKTWDIDDEYMFGPDILVAPVLKENVSERKVYFPSGKWKDIESGKVYIGGDDADVPAPIDVIPVFVKENAVVFD